MPYLKHNGAEIFYEVQGNGPVVLLIAGLASDSQSWQFITKPFAREFTLITYDNRGTGRTKISNNNFTIQDMAMDAKALLQHLDVEECMITGHSMGGCIAQDLTLSLPGKIKKLVLASTTTTMSERNRSLFDHFITDWESNKQQEKWLRNLFYWLFSPSAFKNKKFLDAAIIYTMCYPYQQTLESFRSQIQALIRFDSTAYVNEITTDTLIVSGSKDILVYPDESEMLKSIAGFKEFKLIMNAAHSIHAEYPEEFTSAVIPFLKG